MERPRQNVSFGEDVTILGILLDVVDAREIDDCC